MTSGHKTASRGPADVVTGASDAVSQIWYSATLTREQSASGHARTIQRWFADAISGLVDAEGMWLFATGRLVPSSQGAGPSSRETPTDVEAVFFSPASIPAIPHLIAHCQAQPGPPPERTRAVLLVGDDSAWAQLPYANH